MFTIENIKKLNEIKSNKYNYVSLYLNLDQKNNSTEKINIKLKNLLTKVEDELTAGQIDKIKKQVPKSIINRARGVVFFVGKADDKWFFYEFKKPMASAVFVEHNLHLAPLQKLIDEHERYAVMVADKEKTKIFVVYMGEIEEMRNISEYFPGRHAQGGWSQKRYQGHVDEHSTHNLKNFIAALYSIWKEKRFDRLILGGTDEIIAQLKENLPIELKNVIAGDFKIELFKSTQKILDKALVIAEQAEREKEKELIMKLENNLGDGNKAVSGVRDVLDNLNNKKVLQLIVHAKMEHKGYYCMACDLLLLEKNCSCGGEAMEVDLMDEMVQKALDQNAEVQFVEWEDKMDKLGNIGAILRY